MISLLKSGLTMKKVGEKFNISKQRVQQLVRSIYKSDNYIKEREAFYKAIVILRDYGNLSFYMIAKLLQGQGSDRRNIIYYYKRDKEKYNKIK